MAKPGESHESGWPQSVRNLLDDRRLVRVPIKAGGVAAIWEKAVDSASDAALTAISIDGSLRAAYDAGHSAAVALLLAHGLRTGSSRGGHHELAFSVASSLAPRLLPDLVPDSEEVRILRKESVYDPVIAREKDRDKALEWMRHALPAIRKAIISVMPALDPRLKPYP